MTNIDSTLEACNVTKVYNTLSRVYFLTSFWKKKAQKRSLEIADIKPDEKILEVGMGAGLVFSQILEKVSKENMVYGVDLYKGMVKKSQEQLSNKRFSNFKLQVADAHKLPFEDNTFDLVYSSYMLDLISINETSAVLKEFHRVLKPGGRVVILVMSKEHNKTTLWEKLYQFLPFGKVVLGGCRPLNMESFFYGAGLRELRKEWISDFISSEVFLAKKK